MPFSTSLISDGIYIGGNASMSSSSSQNRGAENAIDGLYLPSQHGINEASSLALTTSEISPWIQVDLSISYYVYGVKIWQRSESDVASK